MPDCPRPASAAENPYDRLPDDKRAPLLAAAMREFSANGYSQASLNRIIGAVGMSKSSFYHFFSNKADLFCHTFSQALEPVLNVAQTLEVQALGRETFWPVLAQVAEQLAQVVDDQPDVMAAGRMFYRAWEDPEGRAIAQELLGQLAEWLRAALRHGQALGVLRDDLPESLTLDLVLGAGMAMDRWVLANWDDLDEAERARLPATGLDLMRRILEPPATTH